MDDLVKIAIASSALLVFAGGFVGFKILSRREKRKPSPGEAYRCFVSSDSSEEQDNISRSYGEGGNYFR